MSAQAFEKVITVNGARLLVWKLTETVNELALQLTELNTEELEARSSEKRKLEFLGVRAAFKTLLGKEIGIAYDADGKPFLSDNSYQISISHSGKWIAVMAHPTQAVGIDIEIPTTKIQKIYTRFLSEKEQQDLSNGENIQQLQLAWSAKEALYKIIGKRAVDFANQLQILPFEVAETGTIKALHIPTNTYYQLYYIQNPAYALVYCIS